MNKVFGCFLKLKILDGERFEQQHKNGLFG